MKGRKGQLRYCKLPIYFLLLLVLLVGCGKDDGPPKITQEDIEEIKSATNSFKGTVHFVLDEYTESTEDGYKQNFTKSCTIIYDTESQKVIDAYNYIRAEDGSTTRGEDLQIPTDFETTFTLFETQAYWCNLDLYSTFNTDAIYGDDISACWSHTEGFNSTYVTLDTEGRVQLVYATEITEDGPLYSRINIVYNEGNSGCTCGCEGDLAECGPDCEMNGGDNA